MIDIESVVFSKVATALRSQYRGIYVYGEYVETPKSFPCVCLVEDDNYPYNGTATLEDNENYVKVVYTLTVYSNSEDDKKSQAKEIMASADAILKSYNFNRTMRTQVPNVDRTIYRIMARYEAVVQKGIKDGDDIKHYIYRR